MNEECERDFLLKLKSECGEEFVHKVENMFADINLNTEMMK